MVALVDLEELRGQHSTMRRDEAKQRVLAITRDLHALAATSYGPAGRLKVLVPNEDAVDAAVVTTSAERICDRIGASDCPIANVYLHILKSRLRNHSDCGLFTMLLSSKLLLEAHNGQLSSTPSHLIAYGFRLSLEWCLAYISDESCPVRFSIDWSDTVALHAVMRGILASKPVATAEVTARDDTIDALLRLLVDAFISVHPFVLEHHNESLPVRFIHDPSYAESVAESRLHKNAVILGMPSVQSQQLLPLRDASVVLFSVSLDPSRDLNDEDGDASNGISTAVGNDQNTDFSLLRQLGDAISRQGVRAVLSQKLIPMFLQEHLAKNRVISIERLGITHMRAVQLLTGATPIGDWRSLTLGKVDPGLLGFVSTASTITVNHMKMLLMENAKAAIRTQSPRRAWPVSTIVLTSPQEHAYGELVHTIMCCFKRMVSLMESPDVVAGAGCTEIHLAAWLRQNAEHFIMANHGTTRAERSDQSTLRHLRCVVRAFSDVLEDVAITLDHGVHGMKDEVVGLLREANTATLMGLPNTGRYSVFGWDPFQGEPRVVACVLSEGDDTSSSSTSSDSDGDEADGACDGGRRLDSAFVLDALETKRDALSTAVDCATALLRVAGVVWASA